MLGCSPPRARWDVKRFSAKLPSCVKSFVIGSHAGQIFLSSATRLERAQYMKKHKKQKKIRYEAPQKYRLSKKQRIEEMNSKDLLVSIRRVEKDVFPVIQQARAGPAAALFLLAQYTHVFTVGTNQFSQKSAMRITKKILSLWQAGFYIPDDAYPFTLEETLHDMQGGMKARNDYSDSFQTFAPRIRDEPQGIGQIAGGIAKHPETNLWQIWMVTDELCAYLGAYCDPEEAQQCLEEIVQSTRRGITDAESNVLYARVWSQGDGQTKQFSFDMMAYLLEHLHHYTIHF